MSRTSLKIANHMPRAVKYLYTWGCNFPMALCWQMFYCGPLSRFIFRAIFRKQLQAENQEQH